MRSGHTKTDSEHDNSSVYFFLFSFPKTNSDRIGTCIALSRTEYDSNLSQEYCFNDCQDSLQEIRESLNIDQDNDISTDSIDMNLSGRKKVQIKTPNSREQGIRTTTTENKQNKMRQKRLR